MWDGPVDYPGYHIVTWWDHHRGWRCNVCERPLRWGQWYVLRREFCAEHKGCWTGW